MRDAKLSNEIIIPQEESISFFILSNCCVNITFLDDIVNMSENNDIELSNSVKSQTYESQLYFHKEQLVWNGKIIYGLMRSEYNYSYKFEDSYLEINGELFKKN